MSVKRNCTIGPQVTMSLLIFNSSAFFYTLTLFNILQNAMLK